MRTLLSLSVAVLAGLLMTRVAKPLKLPSVTAYLVAGVLVGPYCLGLLGIEGLGFPTQESVDSLSLISEVALGFIAFSIGAEFRVSGLKHTGKQAFVIGVLQALAATFLVDIALIVIALLTNGRLSIAQAITLGAIATATAPAATLMVVRQYKAKGPLVDLLLPIVALGRCGRPDRVCGVVRHRKGAQHRLVRCDLHRRRSADRDHVARWRSAHLAAGCSRSWKSCSTPTPTV